MNRLTQRWGALGPNGTWVGGPLDGWKIPAYSDMTPAQEHWAHRAADAVDAVDELGFETAVRGLVHAVLRPGSRRLSDVEYRSSPPARSTTCPTTPSAASSASHPPPVQHRIREAMRRLAHEQAKELTP